ncbi:MAG: HIT family protein [Candidatus Woesearchaeota archaeon]
MTSIFSKIIAGEIPSTKLHEDDTCIVILDLYPNHKGHALVIPKKECETMLECPEEILSHLIVIAKRVAQKQIEVLKCDGFNLTVNNKPAAGQEVPHLHLHVIPRYQNDGYKHAFGKEQYAEGEMQKYGEMLHL